MMEHDRWPFLAYVCFHLVLVFGSWFVWGFFFCFAQANRRGEESERVLRPGRPIFSFFSFFFLPSSLRAPPASSSLSSDFLFSFSPGTSDRGMEGERERKRKEKKIKAKLKNAMQNNHDHNLVMISNLIIIIIIITVAPPLHPTIDTCSGDDD